MGKWFVGFLVGTAVGMLVAPKSGEEMREDLADTVHEGMKKGRAKAQDIAGRARQMADQAQEQIGRALDTGTRAYREAKDS